MLIVSGYGVGTPFGGDATVTGCDGVTTGTGGAGVCGRGTAS